MKKVYILVTIDTECDKDHNWEIPRPMSFKNITLQNSLLGPLFKKHKIRPTYLLSPEVLADDDSIRELKSLKNVEFGTHLHEEFIEPNANFKATRAKNIQAELDYHIEYKKLENLTELFHNRFGYHPKYFRSGRFGSSKNTPAILGALGYKVDSSVVPYRTLYFNNNIKINHWSKSVEPYFETSNSEKKLLQIPLTLINRDYAKLPSFILGLLESKPNILKKIFKRLGYTSTTEWLRPYRTSAQDMIGIVDYLITNSFIKQDFAVVNIMFHSNEILEGASPYCQTKKEVANFIADLDVLFNYIATEFELCSTGLEGVYDMYFQGSTLN